MPESWRNPIVLGLLVGWAVGVAWWVGLSFAFGPSVEVTSHGEYTITPLDRAKFAPIAAIPWAVVGLLVGGMTALVRSHAAALGAALGAVLGGLWAINSEPFDGWLAMTMLVYCLSCAVVGMLVGATWAVLGRSTGIRTGRATCRLACK